MATKDRYYVVSGIVQFDPQVRDYNGRDLTDVVVKAVGSQKLVKVTLWPEFDVEGTLGRAIEKGDYVCADGKYTVSDHEGKKYHNLSASSVVVVGAVSRDEREVVNDESDDDNDDEDDAPF